LRDRDSFQLGLFVKNKVLQRSINISARRRSPTSSVHRTGITGADGHIYAWCGD